VGNIRLAPKAQVIYSDGPMPRFYEAIAQVTADETGPTSNKNTHGNFLSILSIELPRSPA
jgi:hypothetical protein